MEQPEHQLRSQTTSVALSRNPSNALENFQMSLQHGDLLSPVPRVPLPPARQKRPSRPSTASSAEDKVPLLPSAVITRSVGDSEEHASGGSSAANRSGDLTPPAGSRQYGMDIETYNDFQAHPDDRLNLGVLPRTVYPPDVAVGGSDPESGRLVPSLSDDGESEYDWAAFVNAYGAGQWDPHHTPRPPRSHITIGVVNTSSFPSTSNPSSPRVGPESRKREPSSSMPLPTPSQSAPPVLEPKWHPLSASSSGATSGSVAVTLEAPTPPKETISEEVPSEPAPAQKRVSPSVRHRAFKQALNQREASDSNLSHPKTINRAGPGKLALPPSRLRSLDIRPSLGSISNHPSTPGAASGDTMTSAAAIRWAGSNVSFAPLALPSPERELTDPMRGVTAAIPGSHPPDMPLFTPGGTRLTSFWRGTQEVEDARFSPTTEESPANTPERPPTPPSPSASTTPTPPARARGAPPTDGASVAALRANRRASIPPAASAPLLHNVDPGNDDYFGITASLPPTSRKRADSGEQHEPGGHYVIGRDAKPSLDLAVDFSPSTVPALPRRVNLTRQTSAPLPVLLPRAAASLVGRKASEVIPPHRTGRAAKEEHMFSELGYLAPPMPADELERRRALYKFNIWNTGPDPNFDRIVHLAKLVFSTKIVVISLSDGNLEWFKAQSGMKEQTWVRATSLAAHVILQRGDEPMVVLDTREDWRFAHNPLVLGEPHIRFYAGAPLRTQDGFNIGSLSVFDDAPRAEFNPRQRHTLKEFAAIAMRELELWRDKIQLRIRDRIQNSMEQFTRECLEIDNEKTNGQKSLLGVSTTMDKVYERAARLVKRTLDVEGAIVLDVSHSEVLETSGSEGAVSVVIHRADAEGGMGNQTLSALEFTQLNEFFTKYPDGRISETVVPPCLRAFLPSHIQYALTVPILNVDKRPFALLCAYNSSEHTKRYLEGHELSYLRAIGVIILSAVLKRRMILADKAKSLFISNISHELRTPLHGILAAAELLADTTLTHSQASFLQTVQACGTSLVETVNHVLDFTKLSGNTKSGGVDNTIRRTKADLMQLVEEAVEGCWIGHQARMSALSESEIGSVYAPPKALSQASAEHVETVVDIGHRAGGWTVKCEKGGIRRVLMNIFGNSLKFTSNGYVHVTLRELPRSADTGLGKVKMELSVMDTGKGISQDFLKNQLFHPFSQENPLQTGTGLGLAIVNSIVRSSSVDGNIDVSSVEGVGTDIRITFTAELVRDEQLPTEPNVMLLDDFNKLPTLTLAGFDRSLKGVALFHTVLTGYLHSWGLPITPEGTAMGPIVIINEDSTLVVEATHRRDPSRHFVILTESRGNANVMAILTEYERIGGFARLVYKPGGPSRIRAAIKLCLHALRMGQRSRTSSLVESASEPLGFDSATPRPFSKDVMESTSQGIGALPRRNSEEVAKQKLLKRPGLGPRAFTMHAHTLTYEEHAAVTPLVEEAEDFIEMPVASQHPSGPDVRVFEPPRTPERVSHRAHHSVESVGYDAAMPADASESPTIPIGTGGSILRSSMGQANPRGNIRVLVVEDNSILRNLLVKWLRAKGYEYKDAVDGRDGVRTFESGGPFDVVLLDMSMPILDGVGATAEIRSIESARKRATSDADSPTPTRILALTGMSSLEDKRRAFEAGVDGYLVKPVAFKTLDEMFHKLGLA